MAILNIESQKETKEIVLNQKLFDRLQDDFKKIEKELMKKSKTDLINQSYFSALYVQVADTFFDYIFGGDFLPDPDKSLPYDEKTMNLLINYKGNIIKEIADSYQGFNKPYKWDFWGYYAGFDGTYEVINWWINELKNKLEQNANIENRKTL